MRILALSPVTGARLLVPLLLFCQSVTGSAALPLPDRPGAYQDTTGEGKALVEEMLSMMPEENSEVLGLLKIRPPDGRTVEVPIRMRTRLVQDGWHDIYQTQPVGNRPGEVFVVKHRGRQPNEYLHGEHQRDEKSDLKPISGDDLFRPLAGSDFYLADLGLEFLHWPSQKIVKKEMRKSRSSRVIESLNPNPTPQSYSRVLSWVDYETNGIIMAEAYDHENRKLKEFSIQRFDRKLRQVRSMEMRNESTDSRTLLELNLEVNQ